MILEQSLKLLTAEQTGQHKQAEQQTIYGVFHLLMQIPGQLLVMQGLSLELLTPEQPGLLRQAEQQMI